MSAVGSRHSSLNSVSETFKFSLAYSFLSSFKTIHFIRLNFIISFQIITAVSESNNWSRLVILAKRFLFSCSCAVDTTFSDRFHPALEREITQNHTQRPYLFLKFLSFPGHSEEEQKHHLSNVKMWHIIMFIIGIGDFLGLDKILVSNQIIP